MLAVEDWLFALGWAERAGGLSAVIARANANAAALDRWVTKAEWIEHLARGPSTRSNTSVCLQFADRSDATANAARQKAIVKLLEAEEAASTLRLPRAPPASYCAARRSTRRHRNLCRGSTGHLNRQKAGQTK